MHHTRIVPLILAISLGFGGFLASPGRCLACSCVQWSGPAPALGRSTAVFQGRVTAVETYRVGTGYQGVRATLQVTTVWKGEVARETLVFTGNGGGDCGYPFQQGESYLIYAFTSGGGDPQYFPAGNFTTGTCNGTKPLAQAGEDLAFLGVGTPPAGTPLPGLPNTGAGMVARPPFAALAGVLALLLGVPPLLLARRWRAGAQ